MAAQSNVQTDRPKSFWWQYHIFEIKSLPVNSPSNIILYFYLSSLQRTSKP